MLGSTEHAGYIPSQPYNHHAEAWKGLEEMLINITIFTGFSVCHDTACHSTCNLTTKDVCTIRSCDNCICMFVLLTCFWEPSLMEVTIKMLYRLYDSIYREPIGMNVP